MSRMSEKGSDQLLRDSILSFVDNLAIWRRASQRAPHKPLLLLLYLGKVQHNHDTIFFSECVDELESLLREFGPPRKTYHPEYPFWFMQNDGLWEVTSDFPMTPRSGNTNPPKRELLAASARGRIPNEYTVILRRDATLFRDVTNRLLSAHFPVSIHEDVLAAVGISFDEGRRIRAARSPQFRSEVLRAYEYRCAVCGLDLRIRNTTIGLEAAHIKWHQAGGPDDVTNGLSLCVLHHKLLDLGTFMVDDALRLLVSQHVNGTGQLRETLMRHHGKILITPDHPNHRPAQKYLAWHRAQVFQGDPRALRDDR